MKRDGRASLTLEGGTEPLPAGLVPTTVLSVTPQYFTTVGVRITAGRAFEDRDRKASVPVAIVDETVARAGWGGTALPGPCWGSCGIPALFRSF